MSVTKRTHAVKKYKRLKRELYKYVPLMMMAYFAINILGLVLPLVMKRVYGDVVIEQSVSTLQILLLSAFGASFLEAVLKKVKDTTARWAASVYEYRLSNLLVHTILHASDSNTSKNYISDLEKLNSASGYCGYQANKLYQMLIDLPFMMLYLYVIYWIGGSLVLTPIVIIFIYYLGMRINAIFYSKSRKEEIELSDDALTVLTETLEKIHTIKGTGMEAAHIRRYKEKLKGMTSATYNNSRADSLGKLITGNIGQIVLFSILIVGGYMMNRGGISFGDVTACAMLGSRAMTPMIHMLGNYNQKYEMKLIQSRLESLLYRQSVLDVNTQSFPEDIEGTIELIDMPMKAFIPRGSLTTISPREQTGYRKLFRQISGLEKIEQGKILIDSLDISKWDIGGLDGKLQYVRLPVSILKGSVIDNITLYNENKSQNAYLVAELTGLDSLVSQMPEGYETQLDSASHNQLSAPFLQRLNLSRALVDRPRVMILDCLEEGMDRETRLQYIWLLERLKGDVTMVVATNMEEIRNLATHELTDIGIMRRD